MLNIKIKNNNSLYKIIFFGLILLANLYRQTNESAFLYHFFQIGFWLLFVIMIIIYFFSIKNIHFSAKQLIILFILVCISLFGLIFKDMNIFFLSIFCIFSFYLSSKEIVNLYNYSVIITLVSFVLLSILNFLPLWNNGNLVLGFNNKNTTGYYIFYFAFVFYFINHKYSFINYFITFSCFILEWYLIQDRTAAILILLGIVLLVTPFIEKITIRRILVILPIFLVLVSAFLTINFGKYIWINNLDKFLSWRISIWNNSWNMYTFSLIPQNINSVLTIARDYSLGQQYTLSGFDGFFALGVLQDGILLFIWIIVNMLYVLQYFVKNLSLKNRVIYILSILFILFNFTEKVSIVYFLCWLIPLAVHLEGEVNVEY